MSKKGKKNLSGGMAGLSLEDGGSDGSDEELEQVEVRSSRKLPTASSPERSANPDL